jgi:pyridoxal phosphate enzyme (YggS family)
MSSEYPDASRREAELVSALGAVRARIAAACADAGRDPQQITLVAVTKTYPASDVLTLVRLGVTDIGESKDQEARAKAAAIADSTSSPRSGQLAGPIRWHLVGRLQTNKARSVASYAAAVHSVDRVRLAEALADATADRRDNPLDVFVQVSLDDDPDRGGVPVAGLGELAAAVAARPGLRLRGVMAIPPIDADPDAAFARLAELSADIRAEHPDAVAISAGMSADLEAAVRHGATHLRVGTALLGRREPNFG